MKPKKYLGQNFLKNERIAEKIVAAANVNKNDIVLEVGPGRGILTDILIRKAHRVVAVEKDKELADFLMDKYSAKGGSASGGKGQKKLSVINEDILRFNPDTLRGRGSDPRRLRSGRRSYKIVANIPYYITSHFLRKFLESDYQSILMALMVQKEVAERIVARDGKESILSISVKSYGQPKIITKVPAGNFYPKPKVDSAIILIDKISKNFFVKNRINEKKFFQMVKQGFGHKRKMLKNNLKISTETLQKCKIPALSRAEELDLNNWKCLYKNLF
jgi:16S rRNA (adenine1518-N6/adenine1519-N6)-dimethyltransferase